MKRTFLSLIFLLTFWLVAAPRVLAQISGPPPLKVEAQSKAKKLAPGAASVLRVRFTLPQPFHINANPASENYLIPTSVKLASTRDFVFGAPQYPKGEKKKFAFSEKPLSVYEGTIEIAVPFTVSRGAKAGARVLAGTLRYQPCNDQSCFAPSNVAFRATVEIGGAPTSANANVNANTTAAQNSATPQNDAPNATASLTEREADASKLRRKYAVRGIPDVVFIDANGRERTDLRSGEELTRETFLAKLASLQSGEKWRGADEGGASGWADRLGKSALWLQLLLVFFGGLLLNLTPCVYPMIPLTVGYFGAQSEGRIGKTFTLALFYVIGLSLVYSLLGVLAAKTGDLFGSLLQSPWVLFGVAAIFLALSLSMLGLFVLNPPQFLMRGGSQKGVLGAFGMGALLGIVAAPCVGPAVSALLIYVGQRGDVTLGFLLFFVLSLGLGLPYLLLGAFSGALKSLPRSGKWMVTSKKIFAIPILVAAFYYAYLGISAFGGSRAPASTRDGHWASATQSTLQKARAAQQPVVIDFRADWCLPCRKMEREIFSKPDVLKAAHSVQLLQADLTRAGS